MKARSKPDNSRLSRRKIYEQFKIMSMKYGVMHNTKKVNSMLMVEDRQGHTNHD